jgi:hypothetical protein
MQKTMFGIAEKRIQEYEVAVQELPRVAGYLVKRSLKGAVHLWDGDDTACRLASTGGLCVLKYAWYLRSPGGSTCENCLRNRARQFDAPTIPAEVLSKEPGVHVGENFHRLRAEFAAAGGDIHSCPFD